MKEIANLAQSKKVHLNATSQFVTTLVKEALYSGIQSPVLGISQIVDKVAKTNLSHELAILPMPKPAKLGTTKWLAQTIGQGIGMILPFCVSKAIVNPIFKTNLSENLALQSLPVSESIASGAVYGGLFQRVNNQDSNQKFITDRLFNSFSSAALFGSMTAMGNGLEKLANSSIISQALLKTTLNNPVSVSVIPGIIAGGITSEGNSLYYNHKLASSQELLNSSLSYAVLGGLFGSLALIRKPVQLESLKNSDLSLKNITEHKLAESQDPSLISSANTAILDSESKNALALLESYKTMSPEALKATNLNNLTYREAKTLLILKDNFNDEAAQLYKIFENKSLYTEAMARHVWYNVPKDISETDYQQIFTPPTNLSTEAKETINLIDQYKNLSLAELKEMAPLGYTFNEVKAIMALSKEWPLGSDLFTTLLSNRSKAAYLFIGNINSNNFKDNEEAFIAQLQYTNLIAAQVDVFGGIDQYSDIEKAVKYRENINDPDIIFKNFEEAKAFIKLFDSLNPLSNWLYDELNPKVKTVQELTRLNIANNLTNAQAIALYNHYEFNPQEIRNLANSDSFTKHLDGWLSDYTLPSELALKLSAYPYEKRIIASLIWPQIKTQYNLTNTDITNFTTLPNKEIILNHFNQELGNLESQNRHLTINSLTDTTALPLAIKAIHRDVLSNDENNHLTIALEQIKEPFKLISRIKPIIFKQALEFVHENSKTGDIHSKALSALKLSLIFGKSWPNWLKSQEKLGFSITEATEYLPSEKLYLKNNLGEFLLKNAQRKNSDLQSIADNFNNLPEEIQKLPFNDILTYTLANKYPQALDPQFAYESARSRVELNDYLNFENRYLASLKTPSPFPTHQTWQDNGLNGYFLPRNDPRGLFLGFHSNSCQHPNGSAWTSAWYGQESPNSGFFVVTDKTGEIVAQSWAVVTENHGLLLDNIEAKGINKLASSVTNIYKMMGKSLLSQYPLITIGTSHSDLNLDEFKPANGQTLKLPHDFSGYTDSLNQVILAQEPKIPLADLITPALYTRGALNIDTYEMEKIAKQRYPEGWKFIPWNNKKSQGLILETPQTGILGYSIYEPKDHYISDLAISSQAPKVGAWYLLNDLAKKLTDISDTWQADLRESTSYRLLKSAQKTKRLEFLSDTINENTMDGENMHKVKFKFLP